MVRRLVWIVFFLAAGAVRAETVALLQGPSTPQSAYAARKLTAALSEHGYTVKTDAAGSDYQINLALAADRLKPEEFTVSRDGHAVSITGADSRALIYGALDVAESLRNGTGLGE